MRVKVSRAVLLAVAFLVVGADSARCETRATFCKSWRGFAAPEGEGRLGRTLLRRSDLFNGATWLGVGAAIHFGTDLDDRWSDTNSFDRSARSDLVAGSRNGRDDAATASDVLLGLTTLAPLVLDAGVKSWLSDRDCDLALEIASDWTESMSFLWAITEATKVAAGRERPFVRGCDGNPGYASNCNGEDRFASFFSGHASLSAGAAALLCKDALQRGVWGENRVTQSLVCGAGVGAAVGTGMLRIVSDKHWMTDVLVGWAVGGLVGWFDLPGPFDLFRFKYDRHGTSVEGSWVPVVDPDSFGVAMKVRF